MPVKEFQRSKNLLRRTCKITSVHKVERCRLF